MVIKKLLSIPANLVKYFHQITQKDSDEWFCTSDPIGSKIGSGGGTTWLLEKSFQHDSQTDKSTPQDIQTWMSSNKRIIIHAGGQSRRLPSYAPSGKILTPIPVFRWARGQRIDQTLLDLQLPLLDRMISSAPPDINTLIASGDVYIRCTAPLTPIPNVDVVCYGLWGEPSLATNHGVFVSHRSSPSKLQYMLQKPSVSTLDKLIENHLFLIDIGIWLLSDRAVNVLMRKSHNGPESKIGYYDLYSDFGLALGEHPTQADTEINNLTVAIIPLQGGEFYHYGTSKELLSSTLALQNLITDQRDIIQRKVKVHPAIFTQNAEVAVKFTSQNAQVWIENSCISSQWKLTNHHILTGIPQNTWNMSLPPQICIDIIPIGETQFVVRPYGYFDTFKGDIWKTTTMWMNHNIREWCLQRDIDIATCGPQGTDIQSAKIFPICNEIEEIEEVLHFMIDCDFTQKGRALWLSKDRLSADMISDQANLIRLYAQRKQFLTNNLTTLAKNYKKSVFYQLNLKDLGDKFVHNNLTLPSELSEQDNILMRMQDTMFRAHVLKYRDPDLAEFYDKKGFKLLSQTIIDSNFKQKKAPHLTVYPDQIVWSRSPVRIDLAGGWTDTPPHCIFEGGCVVNVAIELNGQPPIQVYIKPTKEYQILFRSIDLGSSETIQTWEELRKFNQIGSPFSIPKAAVALAGFLPEFGYKSYPSLQKQLQDFGAGFEVTLLSAIPAGSGLGTSSILATTVLGGLNDFCGLTWNKNDICQQALILEQLLTSGGGWQDQYGGVFHGIKLLQTPPQMVQIPAIKWAPNHLFSDSLYKECHLLYYTGITRVAKNILTDIVRNMFLNSTEQLELLTQMKQHAIETFDAIQSGKFEELGYLVGKSWTQNKLLDAGTNPASVMSIIAKIQDYILGCKLPGAGGGGYLYMIAKDPTAARRIREILTQNPPNNKARFVELNISNTGLQISRS